MALLGRHRGRMNPSAAAISLMLFVIMVHFRAAKGAILGATDALESHFIVRRNGRESLTFDFDGEKDKSYCMVSDRRLQVNVHMSGLPPGTTVASQPGEDVALFQEGTWMSALGIMYIDHDEEQQRLTIELDQLVAQVGGELPFILTFNGDPTIVLNSAQATGSTIWRSTDSFASVSRVAGRPNALLVIVPDVLEMELEAEVEEDIITDPPVYFLNFDFKRIVVGAEVHGFLGQMFAPGAEEARSATETLDGFLLREYVEGVNADYETSGVTSTDCIFNRYNMASDDKVLEANALEEMGATLQNGNFQSHRLGRRLMVQDFIGRP
ncbi:hypothetical protein KFL_000830380 [Klebsormidium nitens]|uniref:Uncharacterized protein n=1 Tax=Klebsormidium nitens TaxID=105231 RepID=A0A1Y1HYF4_KLENI|nr:hypothetical protein KFL_000830380 [Klebsormidium nitens]|eukprot:GAQ81556.1 hypothetical protein KFL_000830380 [Klebsormidium nitens]